jgi:hypothetical protein
MKNIPATLVTPISEGAVMPNLVRLACRRCGKPLKASSDLAGRPGKCPRCGEVFVVPTHAAATGLEHRLGSTDRNGVLSAVRSGSRILSVLESLVGHVPYGMAAWARWHDSGGGRTGIVRWSLGAIGLSGQSEASGTRQHVGCIAVRDESVYFLDFGCGGDEAAFERHLFDLVRHGIVPTVLSSPRSSLTVKALNDGPCQALLLYGALQMRVYPGIGSAFPAPLLTALAPVE